MIVPHPPALSHAERIRRLTEKRRRILAMPAEDALKTILDEPQPAALVHSFSEEDLHFLIHDIGPEDALPLIALASTRQWEYMLDIEGWNRDRLDYPVVTTWLQLLLQADPNRLVNWCFEERLEFLELYMFRNIELRIREEDLNASDFGEGYLTDDDTFYIRLVDYPATTPEEESLKSRRDAMLSQLLRRLSLFDHARYQGMLLEAVNVIPAEIEEELFRQRNVRLGEKGFLPFHEAVGVYQPLRPGDLAAKGNKRIRETPPDELSLPVPQFTSAFFGEDNLFVRALKSVREAHVIDQLQVELAGLCNRVISADQMVITSRRQLHLVVTKISGYLSIGLELLTQKRSGNRESAASALLRHHLLGDIFRAGFAEALELKWEAGRWYESSWCRGQQVELTFWDEAWLGLLGGLLIERPKYYDPSAADSNYRDFRTIREIEDTRRNLAQVIALDRLFGDMQLAAASRAGGRRVTYKNLLLTSWARAWLDIPPLAEVTAAIAVALADFKTFYAHLWIEQDGRRLIEGAKKGEFLQWAAEAAGQSPTDLSDRLGSVFEALFDEIERELGPVKTGNLDPRYVNLFILKH